MRLFGQIQSGLAPTGGAGKGNAGWFQVADTMRRDGDGAEGDGAMTGLTRKRVGAAAGELAEAMDFSDVRLERVAKLRAAIASGSYMVSAAALADRMAPRMLGGTGVSGRS
jgi:anti-sigma28 factor (negative regulator of flagellin synthesis)